MIPSPSLYSCFRRGSRTRFLGTLQRCSNNVLDVVHYSHPRVSSSIHPLSSFLVLSHIYFFSASCSLNIYVPSYTVSVLHGIKAEVASPRVSSCSERMSDSKVNSQSQEGDRFTMLQVAQNAIPATTNHSNIQTTIPDLYHLVGLENYSAWAFRMKNVLQRNGLYEYCITVLSQVMAANEKKGRQLALSTINGSVKGTVAIKLLKRYTDPNECWTSLKTKYESDSTSRQVLFIDKFFSIRKLNSMDEYLADMKEAADSLEELDVPLPEKILVAYILKNLPPEYDMVKQIIMNERKLPSYLDLEARLLNEETTKKTQHN